MTYQARTASLAVFITALATATGFAQPPGGGLFDRFDRNRDGKLSRDEMPVFVRERFDAIDKNKDGFVSREEDLAFVLPRRPGGTEGPGGRFMLPATVQAKHDIHYAATTDPRQTLDLYLPRAPKGKGPLPVFVNIHGGAFKMGDKTMGVREIADLVSGGAYAAASINYRLSGQAIWPAQIHDCKAAIRWIRAHAKEYNLDPDRIGVIGASAGGHLVAMLGTSGGVESLEGDVGSHRGISSKVTCVVDQFGPSELLAMGGDHNSPSSPESLLVGGTLQEHKGKARAASPITYVTRGDPPFLIIHGTRDPAVPFNQSERLAAALNEAGVSCVFIPVVGAGHGGFRSPEVPRRIRQFFDTHLRGQSVGTVSSEPIPDGGPAPAPALP